MIVALKDGTEFSAMRVSRSYDMASMEVILTIEFAVASMEDIAECDFSEITIKRPGRQDKQFTGYIVRDISESYDDRYTSTSVSLVLGDS